jgi:hypothetical protein
MGPLAVRAARASVSPHAARPLGARDLRRQSPVARGADPLPPPTRAQPARPPPAPKNRSRRLDGLPKDVSLPSPLRWRHGEKGSHPKPRRLAPRRRISWSLEVSVLSRAETLRAYGHLGDACVGGLRGSLAPLPSALCPASGWLGDGGWLGGWGRSPRPSGAQRQVLRSARAPGGRAGGRRRWPRASVVGKRGEQRGSARRPAPARSRAQESRPAASVGEQGPRVAAPEGQESTRGARNEQGR